MCTRMELNETIKRLTVEVRDARAETARNTQEVVKLNATFATWRETVCPVQMARIEKLEDHDREMFGAQGVTAGKVAGAGALLVVVSSLVGALVGHFIG